VCVQKEGGDYRCLFISFIWYPHICTVGVNIKSTHAVHLSLQVCTYDSNYRAFATIKIRTNVYMLWPSTILYKNKKKEIYLSVQCHLIVLDRLSWYSQKNKKKQKNIHIFIIIHVNEIKYWKHHVGLYICTPFWQRFYIHIHTRTYQVTSYIRMSNYLTYDNDNIEK